MKIEEMLAVDVNSSSISRASYHPPTKSFYLQFKNKTTYQYSNVPLSVWEDFLSAPSKGKFFHKALASYSYTKL